ncbi:PTS lactose/cellobiose transporter subunit IIA [Thermoanaerobacteraceae bacterium SP2]|nr:PTS lactose/cellobiose transporter subunit IIA [Thermoanaerobacteraceae bacterium SP2]
MENINFDDKLINAAMSIIIHAGDARNYIKEALDFISFYDFKNAEEKLRQANEKISIAHKAQTDMIQGEAQGKGIGYSLLFTHAQDTLMTIKSELNISRQLLKIFKSLDERISKIEK